MKKLKISEWAGYNRKLGVQMAAGLKAGLQRAGQRAVAYLVEETTKKQIVNNGDFRRGWKFSTPENNVLRIYNDVPYSMVVERGRRAGASFPPRKAIENWVRRKLGVSGEAEIRSIAFVVAAKIQRDGIPGKFIMRDAYAMLSKMIKEEVNLELKARVARMST